MTEIQRQILNSDILPVDGAFVEAPYGVMRGDIAVCWTHNRYTEDKVYLSVIDTRYGNISAISAQNISSVTHTLSNREGIAHGYTSMPHNHTFDLTYMYFADSNGVLDYEGGGIRKTVGTRVSWMQLCAQERDRYRLIVREDSAGTTITYEATTVELILHGREMFAMAKRAVDSGLFLKSHVDVYPRY